MNDIARFRFAGIDVSAATLHVVVDDKPAAEFANDAKGHAAIAALLTKRGGAVRVVVEATSLYHLDLCTKLANTEGCEVMVANPRLSYAFTQAQGRRAKTDAVDAGVLRDFARTMTFVAWAPPAPEVVELRSLARYVDQLNCDATALKNQLHAASATASIPAFVRESLQKRILEITAEIARGAGAMEELAKRHDYIAKHIRNLTTAPGIGETTATRLVAEFLVLDATMTSKEISAWAGLDPRPRESGTSVRGKRPISKRGNGRVRHALFMPAMAVSHRDNEFGAFYQRVAERSAAKMIAVTATMRKMLCVTWAMFRKNAKYDPSCVRPTERAT